MGFSKHESSKVLKAEGAKLGTSVGEPKVGNESKILLILSQKNKANLSARLLSAL